MPELTLRKVVKRFGTNQVIHGVDLDIERGEFVVFVGPSGCGKSTLLRLIAGLEEISDGEFRMDDRRMNEIPAARRGIAMVFQSYALYPHMTVYDNLAFALQTAGERKQVIDQRVLAAAKMLQIDTLLKRKPKALSGGQRQRVAIGRAIVRQPKLFLFDEPLSNLDAELRVQMRVELSKLHAELGTTMIYVTHDQVEAMTMADRIVVLRDGRIEQAGSPLELYNHPANQFVAGFIGSPKMNFLDARLADRGADTITVTAPGGVRLDLPLPSAHRFDGDRLVLGIRPEHVAIADTGVPMQVNLTEQLGANTVLYGSLAGEQPMVAQVVGQSAIRRGDTVRLQLPLQHCHAFDSHGFSIAH